MKQLLPVTVENFFNSNLFSEWLANQPADRVFNYFDTGGCLFASYGKETFDLPPAFTVGGYSIGGLIEGKRTNFIGKLERLNTAVSEQLPVHFFVQDVKKLWEVIDSE